MAQFIDFEVEVSDTEKGKDDEDGVCSDNSLNSFISDSSSDSDHEKTNEESFYCKFDNIETSVDEVLRQEYDQSVQDIDDIDLSNLCESSEEENEIDQFKDSEKRVEKFSETLYPISKDQNNNITLTNTILFNIRYFLENKTDICGLDDLKLCINNNFLFDTLYENSKYKLILDYQKFNANCHEINSLLAKNEYFLRIFELSQKFQYFSLKNPKKQTVVRQSLSCISEKYNGFHVISIEYCGKLRKKFRPIDIIYKPVKSNDEKILCYIQLIYQKPIQIPGELQKKFLTDMHLSVIIAVKFLLEQTNKNDILKVAVVFLGLFIISIIRT